MAPPPAAELLLTMLAWSVAAMEEYWNDGFASGLLPPPADPKCVCLLMMSTGVSAVSESSARGEVSASKLVPNVPAGVWIQREERRTH